MSVNKLATVMVGIATAMTSIAANAQLSQKFDLYCDIQWTGTGRSFEDAEKKPTKNYRIDLDKMLFCDHDKCNSVSKLNNVNENFIIFNFEERDEEFGSWSNESVNRRTGEYFHGYGSRTWGRVTGKGACRRAPFSGFPSQKF